jgi:hypothetical protein
MEDLSEFDFKGSQAGVEQIPFRDDDDVEPRGGLGATENLSYQSFSFISLNRATQFTGRGNPQASLR